MENLSSERNRNKNNSEEILRKLFRKYHIFGCFVLLLIFFLVCSLHSEMVYGMSLVERREFIVPGLDGINTMLLRIINAETVLKMAEAVGISSIPIACIYASLDQMEMGFYYRELLEELYPQYDRFVVIHLVSVLICLWTATAGLLESSFISLLIILAGCALQWSTLKNIVLSADERRRIALDRWVRLIRQKQNLDDLKFMVLRMADAITLATDKSYHEMLEKFSVIFCEFVVEWDKPDSAGKTGYQGLIGQIQTVWKHLLAGKEMHEQFLFTSDVLRNCEMDRNYNLICASYVIYRCEDASMMLSETNGREETALEQVANSIIELKEREFPDKNAMTRLYLDTVFTMIVWMKFSEGRIILNEKLLALTPEPNRMGLDQKWVEAIAKAVPIENPKMHFDRVKSQIFG